MLSRLTSGTITPRVNAAVREGLSAPRSDAMAQARHGLQDCKMKSPHAAVLGPHAGQVERIMRRRHAVDQTLPRAIPARLKQY